MEEVRAASRSLEQLLKAASCLLIIRILVHDLVLKCLTVYDGIFLTCTRFLLLQLQRRLHLLPRCRSLTLEIVLNDAFSLLRIVPVRELCSDVGYSLVPARRITNVLAGFKIVLLHLPSHLVRLRHA